MAKFITGNELNSELEKLLETAESQIFLISPYIKLHDRLKSVLLAKKENYNLEIVLVFGKNEEDKSKSLKSNDLEFFKEFPNIEIHYEKRLHAKYYANEKNSILTSMNLYSFSQDNNIEFGVLIEYSFKNKILGNSSLDINAFNSFVRVIEQADLIYKKTPQFESSTLGLTKKYKGSIVEIDNTNSFFKEGKVFENNKKESLNTNSNTTQTGYCIRTGKKIEFNPKQPMTEESYKSWLKFKNEEYPEKYCHFSGELSNGETSFSRPILKKNWKQAKETFKL